MCKPSKLCITLPPPMTKQCKINIPDHAVHQRCAACTHIHAPNDAGLPGCCLAFMAAVSHSRLASICGCSNNRVIARASTRLQGTHRPPLAWRRLKKLQKLVPAVAHP